MSESSYVYDLQGQSRPVTQVDVAQKRFEEFSIGVIHGLTKGCSLLRCADERLQVRFA